mmetsp:Transcript_70692/g.199602  ORF Transcript_70692/g.199602 Transcript_70692/m.199602 type:complete len:153 (+) Transcript_70692:472-930(+)
MLDIIDADVLQAHTWELISQFLLQVLLAVLLFLLLGDNKIVRLLNTPLLFCSLNCSTELLCCRCSCCCLSSCLLFLGSSLEAFFCSSGSRFLLASLFVCCCFRSNSPGLLCFCRDPRCLFFLQCCGQDLMYLRTVESDQHFQVFLRDLALRL